MRRTDAFLPNVVQILSGCRIQRYLATAVTAVVTAPEQPQQQGTRRNKILVFAFQHTHFAQGDVFLPTARTASLPALPDCNACGPRR